MWTVLSENKKFEFKFEYAWGVCKCARIRNAFWHDSCST